MRRHLVLGSEGQIGRYVCDEIEANGDEVIRWDIALDDRYDLSDNYYVYNSLNGGADRSLFSVMRDCDFVHFLAYNVGGSKYLAAKQNSYDYITENVDIMSNVFELLHETAKPFYFASSQMSNMTDSVYGQLKAIGESYTKALGGLNIKFWNVYGYETDPEKTHVITDFIRSALTEGRILCRTDGTERRHFTHAKDAAEILYLLSKPENYKVAVTWPEPPPIVKHTDKWATIRRVALMIAELIPGTEVYFGTKEDQTQTIHNEISGDGKLHSLLYPTPQFPTHTTFTLNMEGALTDRYGRVGNTNSTFNLPQRAGAGISLRDGLADMIDRIKTEGL